MNHSERQANTCNWRQARNDCEHVGIGFGFTFDSLRKWRFFLPTAEQSKAKPKQMHITFNWKLLYAGLDFSTVKHAFAQFFGSWVAINLQVPESRSKFRGIQMEQLLVNCVSLL